MSPKKSRILLHYMEYPEKDKHMARDYASGLFYTMFLYQNKLPLTIPRLECLNYFLMRYNGEVFMDESGQPMNTRKGLTCECPVIGVIIYSCIIRKLSLHYIKF